MVEELLFFRVFLRVTDHNRHTLTKINILILGFYWCFDSNWFRFHNLLLFVIKDLWWHVNLFWETLPKNWVFPDFWECYSFVHINLEHFTEQVFNLRGAILNMFEIAIFDWSSVTEVCSLFTKRLVLEFTIMVEVRTQS